MKFFRLLLLPLLLFSTLLVQGQSKRFTGNWEGKLNVGIELRIVFRISMTGSNQFATLLESPDQSNQSIPCDTTIVNGDSIHIEMKRIKAHFAGRISSDSTLDGIFTQGEALPLLLHKVDRIVQRSRPQTPKPPFPYKSEDVIYKNADRTLQYGATITIPQGKGPFPAALLITGSGAQDRNEDIMGHQLFAVLADYLTRQGYVILRVDDRGVGSSTGQFEESTSADFANDVRTSLNYLFNRKEVDRKKVGLIGHSEGGMIAPMVAAGRKDIAFVILMAGPGVKIIDLMTEQAGAVLSTYGATEDAIAQYKIYYRETASAMVHLSDTTAAIAKAQAIAEQWASSTPESILRQVNMTDPVIRKKQAAALARSFTEKWFQYFLGFDPTPYLEKLRCPVLAINGEKDIQVIARQNLPGIEAALKKAPVKTFDIVPLAGLNHLFQHCTACSVDEYAELEETIAPVALETISNWLHKNIK